jgi:hypothetical protein
MAALAVQTAQNKLPKCTPNLLPCKINHDGPVNASERYWKAETGEGMNTLLYSKIATDECMRWQKFGLFPREETTWTIRKVARGLQR